MSWMNEVKMQTKKLYLSNNSKNIMKKYATIRNKKQKLQKRLKY
jgi:hypothetical protein